MGGKRGAGVRAPVQNKDKLLTGWTLKQGIYPEPIKIVKHHAP